MKTRKLCNAFTLLALIPAIGLAFSNDDQYHIDIIWRKIPHSGGTMEYVADVCTLNPTGQLCSISFPSVGGFYYDSPDKNGYDYFDHEVFLIP